jgi:hypothetical protein
MVHRLSGFYTNFHRFLISKSVSIRVLSVYRFSKFQLIFCFIVFSTNAQEQEEYYRQPDRKQKTRVVNLPNLKGTPIRWYVGGQIGYFKNLNELDSDLDGFLKSSNYGNIYWGLTTGYNFGDKWAVEVGYLSQYQKLWLDGQIGQTPLPYRVLEGKRYDIFPIRFRRNIWAIDKDIRSANVFIGAGILLTTNSPNKQIGSYRVITQPRFNPTRDSVRINLFGSTRAIPKGEVSLEIQGRLHDAFTISAFANAIWGLNGGLRNEIQYFINSNTLNATQINRNFSYNIGLTFRYEYYRGVKYKSRLED